MPEPSPPELRGKAQRVIGFFVFMIGAGLLLETRAAWAGTSVALLGVGLFVWGVLETRPRATGATPASVSVAQATEEHP